MADDLGVRMGLEIAVTRKFKGDLAKAFQDVASAIESGIVELRSQRDDYCKTIKGEPTQKQRGMLWAFDYQIGNESYRLASLETLRVSGWTPY